MDIIQILNAIKGKALDVAHFDILKNAYELQNDNIEQLKSNNIALKENNDLIKEKNNVLEKERNDLRKRIKFLENELCIIKNSNSTYKISEAAEAILCKCIHDDKSEFISDDMLTSFSFSRIQAEAGLDELINLNLVCQTSVAMFGIGPGYSLTPEGKKMAIKITKNK